MLRITEQRDSGEAPAVLHLEGAVAGRWVAELRREVRRRQEQGGLPVVIDLGEVSFIDSAGIEFFDEFASGILVVNCSLFAAEQLKAVLARQQMIR